MSELRRTTREEHDGIHASADRARRRRARRRVLVAGALVLVAVGVGGWTVLRIAGRPSALTMEARRQVGHAVLRADAAAAEIVLADVRAEVTGSLRPDEIRARATEAIDRVRSAVEPVKRSERVPADELEAGLDEVARLLRAGDPAVGEAIAALERRARGAPGAGR